jgi:DNA-binding XRE family transcriptional regulator
MDHSAHVVLQRDLSRKPLLSPELYRYTEPVALVPMQEPDNPESREAIAYRLELMREALTDLNRAAIAASVGVTGPAWTEFAKGRAAPKWEVALRICRRYGVTLEWLYRGQEYGLPADVRSKLRKKASQWASNNPGSRETA